MTCLSLGSTAPKKPSFTPSAYEHVLIFTSICQFVHGLAVSADSLEGSGEEFREPSDPFAHDPAEEYAKDLLTKRGDIQSNQVRKIFGLVKRGSASRGIEPSDDSSFAVGCFRRGGVVGLLKSKKGNKHGVTNYPRFRNYGSETISSDSETTWSGSETAVQQLFSRIQKLFRTDSEIVAQFQETPAIQKLRFRNYSVRFRNYSARFRNYFQPIQKLFREIQKLFCADKSHPPHVSPHLDFQLFSQRYF